MGPQVVASALTSIENRLSPTPQHGEPSRASKISKEEAEIDWNQSSEIILRKIRAFYPSPIAWNRYQGEIFKITSASLSSADLAPSEFRLIDGAAVVGCGSNTAIALTQVIPAGKKEMSAPDWLRGLRIERGTHFGTGA
jgi:methionyl-tRNA formyltransferase